MDDLSKSTQPSRSKGVVNPSYTPLPYSVSGYQTFNEYYPYYLGAHANQISRRLHILGTGIAVITALKVILSFIPPALTRFRQVIPPAKLNFLRIAGGNKGRAKSLLRATLLVNIFTLIGHFVFEKNKPATLNHPFYSLLGDLRLFKEVVLRRRAL